MLWWSLVPSLPPSINTERLGPKSDVWSFGLSLWALAEGRFPYEEVITEELELYQASE